MGTGRKTREMASLPFGLHSWKDLSTCSSFRQISFAGSNPQTWRHAKPLTLAERECVDVPATANSPGLARGRYFSQRASEEIVWGLREKDAPPMRRQPKHFSSPCCKRKTTDAKRRGSGIPWWPMNLTGHGLRRACGPDSIRSQPVADQAGRCLPAVKQGTSWPKRPRLYISRLVLTPQATTCCGAENYGDSVSQSPHQPSMNLVVVLTSPSQPAPRASKNRHPPSTGIDTHLGKCPATYSTRFPRASCSRQRPDAAPFRSTPVFFSHHVLFTLPPISPPRFATPHSRPPSIASAAQLHPPSR